MALIKGGLSFSGGWNKKGGFKIHYQHVSDAGIPAWVSKLGAQIIGELMQNNASHLTISSMQMLHVLRHLI